MNAPNSMVLVYLESPFAGNEALNICYARAAVRDCLLRGEAAFASHLLYTQNGILRDSVPEERALGIAAGFFWAEKAQKSVVYTELGMSRGMIEGVKNAEQAGRPIFYRTLPVCADCQHGFTAHDRTEGLCGFVRAGGKLPLECFCRNYVNSAPIA